MTIYTQVCLTVNSNKLFTTNFGGILSIILTLIASSAFFGFGKDIFERKKPRVSFNRIINDEKSFSIITEKSFLFTIYYQYTDLPIPDFDRRFQTYYNYIKYYGNGTRISRLRNPLVKCSEEVKNDWKEYFSVNPDTYYCLPKGVDLITNGILNQGTYSLLRFQTDYCKNNTDSMKGKLQIDSIPKEE